MNIATLNHKNLCLLGYGKEGRATYQALKKYAPEAKITIADGNPKLTGKPNVALITGPNYLKELTNFDFIIKSPGIPWHPPAKLTSRVTSATEIFLDSLPKGVRVIGVTGTKGKSTTAHLIYQVLKAGGERVFLAGNIGQPMLELLPEAAPGTTFVLELSSYQLETLHTSPHLAVVTSFFPDHLNYHGSLEAYLEAKKNIARFQTAGDVIFYNPAYPECREIADLSAGTKIAFLPTDVPDHHNPAFKGPGNASNMAAAYRVALQCGLKEQTILHALETAASLPHRQEPLGVYHGVQWVDDSAANTPEATIAAIEAWGSEVDTIIVGGLDRGYDFTQLGETLAKSPIANIILFPQTGVKIRSIIEATPGHHPKNYLETSSMIEAARFAAQHTAKGKTVLLSNGSPSYNLFIDFNDRARAFKAAIEALES